MHGIRPRRQTTRHSPLPRRPVPSNRCVIASATIIIIEPRNSMIEINVKDVWRTMSPRVTKRSARLTVAPRQIASPIRRLKSSVRGSVTLRPTVNQWRTRRAKWMPMSQVLCVFRELSLFGLLYNCSSIMHYTAASCSAVLCDIYQINGRVEEQKTTRNLRPLCRAAAADNSIRWNVSSNQISTRSRCKLPFWLVW